MKAWAVTSSLVELCGISYKTVSANDTYCRLVWGGGFKWLHGALVKLFLGRERVKQINNTLLNFVFSPFHIYDYPLASTCVLFFKHFYLLLAAVPPYVPALEGADDTSHFDEFEPESPDPAKQIEKYHVENKGFRGKDLPFVGFTFFKTLALPSSPRKLVLPCALLVNNILLGNS